MTHKTHNGSGLSEMCTARLDMVRTHEARMAAAVPDRVE